MYYGIKVYPYAHPQHLKVLKHFAYIHYGCGMQSMGVCSLIHDTTIQAQPYPSFPKIHPHLHMYYGIRVYPYAHPQHLKVLKHFVYIQYGCGMQSKGVCGLNHDTTTSYRLSKAIPHLHTYYGYKGVPICPSTASQGAKTLCIHPIWMWGAVNGGWQPPVKVFQGQSLVSI
jgi:hypothetical protein